MKTMTCRQLGGACDKKFTAGSFSEIAELSKLHGMQMHKAGDQDHIKAMRSMMDLMREPKAMQQWMESRRKEFEALPQDKQHAS
jgi:hypothetical protein